MEETIGRSVNVSVGDFNLCVLGVPYILAGCEPNPYQPIPNLAALTTIFPTLHKHMAPHGRIPNATTHIHPHTPTQAYPQ